MLTHVPHADVIFCYNYSLLIMIDIYYFEYSRAYKLYIIISTLLGLAIAIYTCSYDHIIMHACGLAMYL